MTTVRLRALRDADLDVLFVQQLDPEANRMAAFGAIDPADRQAFDTHWARIRADPSVVVRAIVADRSLAGSVLRWRDPSLDAPEISYWLGREFWGRGIATMAVSAFLDVIPDRPLIGRAASTNPASVRVLQKCGFRIQRAILDVSSTSGAFVDEVVLRLER